MQGKPIRLAVASLEALLHTILYAICQCSFALKYESAILFLFEYYLNHSCFELHAGTRIIRDWLTKLDVIIIASGYAELLLGMMIDVDFLNTIGIVRILRLSRILRLMQLMRKNRSLKELRKLVTMLATCLKTLVWSFLFCFLVTTGWAMLVVELINPYVLEMQKMEPFDTCPQCVRATSSVMHANLMLFKTVIAGDSWGLIAVPMIEKHPETAIIFVGASLTLVFGVLNLIVAEPWMIKFHTLCVCSFNAQKACGVETFHPEPEA